MEKEYARMQKVNAKFKAKRDAKKKVMSEF